MPTKKRAPRAKKDRTQQQQRHGKDGQFQPSSQGLADEVKRNNAPRKSAPPIGVCPTCRQSGGNHLPECNHDQPPDGSMPSPFVPGADDSGPDGSFGTNG